jgi:hypothetical protein
MRVFSVSACASIVLAVLICALGGADAFAARDATPTELDQFAAALSAAGNVRTCTDGTPATGAQLAGLVSTVDGAWGKSSRNDLGAMCGIGNAFNLMHVESGIWVFRGILDRYVYCADLPVVPSAVMADLSFTCLPTPAGVALGSPNAYPYGKGFGVVKPHTVTVGGEFAIVVSHIHWRHWGQSVATGQGSSPIVRYSDGITYKKHGRVKLKAFEKIACGPGGQLGYSKLKARIVKRPGGRLGKWFVFGSDNNCIQST